MLLLCALMAGSSSVWAASYTGTFTKCTGTLTSGTYIIGDVSGTTVYAINNTVGNSWIKYTETTVSSDKITNPDASLVWEYDATTGYIKSQDGTNYLYWPGGGNKGGCGTTAYAHTITEQSISGNYKVASSADDTRFLKINTTNEGYRYYNNGTPSVCFFKLEAASGPVDPSVTITSTTVAVGRTATISGPEGLTISYSSDKENIATVSDAGVVTGVAAGTAKITATWSAVADTYNAGSQEFTITVVEATVYEKVTNANQLVSGNKYILVATGYNRAMGAVGSNIRGYVDITITNDEVTIIDEEVAVLTLGGSDGAWTFLASDNNEYLAYSGSSNQVHSNADATADASKWEITDNFELESANVSGRVLKYNSGSPRFACYASGQQTAVLFVKAGSPIKLNINSGCTDGSNYYATYSNEKAFVVPSNLTVSAIKVNAGKLSITPYSEGDIVKANTGVLVSSTIAGDHAIVLSNEVGTEQDDNMLVATGDDGVTASAMADTDYYYYRLTMADSKPGFWWKAEDGAGFDLAANKAYLRVPKSAATAARGFSFDFDETTSVSEELRMKDEDFSTASVYNLAGQRVAQPTKGLYIVNGKKVILK